jgi:hypothetical protein
LFLDDVTQDSEEQVQHVLHSVLSSVSTRQRYAEATSMDPTLQLLKTVIRRGWPEKRSQCLAPVKQFWSVVKGVDSLGGPDVATSWKHGGDLNDGHFSETNSVLRAKSAV